MVSDLEERPRKPPISPRIKPRKFIETREKPTIRSDPNFLVYALSYMSQDPIVMRAPATLARIRAVEVSSTGMRSGASWVARKAPSKVKIPENSDRKKAAVGFSSMFGVKAFSTVML